MITHVGSSIYETRKVLFDKFQQKTTSKLLWISQLF